MAAERTAWAVVLRGFPSREDDEVAAVFLDRTDSVRYADWWNREEVIRYGPDSPVTAVPEEIDLYAPGTWRPPALHRVKSARIVDSGRARSSSE